MPTTDFFDKDFYILGAFLLLNIILPLCFRMGNSKSFRSYTLNHVYYSTEFILTCTFVASSYTGSHFLFTLQQGYSSGIIFMLANIICAPLSFYIISKYFVTRIAVFSNSYTLYEWMGREYKSYLIQFVLSLCEIIYKIGIISSQFIFIKLLLSNVLNYSPLRTNLILISLALIVITYSAFGGIRIIAKMDAIQLSFFIIAFLGIFITIFWKTKSNIALKEMSSSIDFNKFNLVYCWKNLDIPFILAYYCLAFLPYVFGEIFQRINMSGGNIRRVKKSLNYAVVIIFILELFVAIISFWIYSINKNLDPGEILPFVLNNYCIEGIKGLFIAALISISIAFADSVLNAETILVINDILPVFNKNKEIKTLKNEIKTPTVKTAIITTYIVGIISLCWALIEKNVLRNCFYFSNFYFSIVLFPVITFLFGYKVHKQSVVVGMISGTISNCICIFLSDINFITIFTMMLTNAIGYITTEYILRKKEKNKKKEIEYYEGGI